MHHIGVVMKKSEIVGKVDSLGKRVNTRVKKLEKRIEELENEPSTLSLQVDNKNGYDPYDNNPYYDRFMIFTFYKPKP